MGSKENRPKVKAKVVANSDGTFIGRLAFAGLQAERDDLIEAAEQVDGVSDGVGFINNGHTLEIPIGDYYDTFAKAEKVVRNVASALGLKISGTVVHER